MSFEKNSNRCRKSSIPFQPFENATLCKTLGRLWISSKANLSLSIKFEEPTRSESLEVVHDAGSALRQPGVIWLNASASETDWWTCKSPNEFKPSNWRSLPNQHRWWWEHLHLWSGKLNDSTSWLRLFQFAFICLLIYLARCNGCNECNEWNAIDQTNCFSSPNDEAARLEISSIWLRLIGAYPMHFIEPINTDRVR